MVSLDDRTNPVRVCALRKTEAQTLKSQEKLRKTAARKNRQLQPETFEAAGFVLVLAILDDTDAEDIMELYRYRWQVNSANHLESDSTSGIALSGF